MNNPKHKLVPLEPTEEMLKAGLERMPFHSSENSPEIAEEFMRLCLEDAFVSMIEASPNPPQTPLHELADELRKEANEVPYDSAETTQVLFRVADQLQAALAAESELRGLERELATECVKLLFLEAPNFAVAWPDSDNEMWLNTKEAPIKRECRYLELRGLLERHSTNETLVRLREDG